jgi:hypothetical protein
VEKVEDLKQLIGFALRRAEVRFHLRGFCSYCIVYVSCLWLYTGLIYLLIQAPETCENEISEKKIIVFMLRMIHDG